VPQVSPPLHAKSPQLVPLVVVVVAFVVDVLVDVDVDVDVTPVSPPFVGAPPF